MYEQWKKKMEIITEEMISHKVSADLVIIGAGHAGTCAARTAAEAGGSVIVLEQQERDRQFILGIGEIGHINSEWQKKHGVPEVDIDEFVQDWQIRTNNRSNYQLIRKYAENCGPCFDWFLDPLTEEEKNAIHPMLTPQSENFPKTINGFHAYSGTPNMGFTLQNKALKGNQKLAEVSGAKFFFETKACQITKKEKRITGVIGRQKDGTFYLFEARKGVLIAAGDYSKNEEMCKELLTEAADLIDDGNWSGHGWDGSGILLGIQAGGRLEPRSHAAMGGNYSFPGFDIIGSTAVLRVNQHGKRYSDEGFGTHILAATAGAKQPNGNLWGIFDSRIKEQVTYQAPCHAVFDYSDPAECQKLDHILKQADSNRNKEVRISDKAGATRSLYCADTLEKLSELLFQTKEEQMNFLNEVKRYNELCKEGRDIDFGKDPHLLFPVEQPPFYACGTIKDSHKPGGQSLKLLVTVTGMLIDENQQVLDEEFEPISGLFATGNSSGCRFGFQYTTSVPGQSISIAQTLGREAGKYIIGLKNV